MQTSWKTIALIAAAFFGLLIMSREIHSWLAYRDAKAFMQQTEAAINEENERLHRSHEEIQQRMNTFDKSFHEQMHANEAAIDAAEKAFRENWQPLEEKQRKGEMNNAQPPGG